MAVFFLFSDAVLTQTLFLKQPGDTTARQRSDTIRSYKNLQGDLESLLNNKDFSNAFIGVYVKSLHSGKVIWKMNENRNFVPASTNKLITTSAALEILGPDFRFTTALYLDGNLDENGEFAGNIIIRGNGDPSFSTTFGREPFQMLDAWSARLDSLGIKSVRGNIIADDRYFDNYYYPPGWAIDDIIYSFSPQVSALSINDNKADIFIKPGSKPGELAKINIEPPNNYIRIINNIVTLPENEPTEINPNKDFKSNIIELKGTIELDSLEKNEIKLSVAVDNPSVFFLNMFRQALEKANIKCRGAIINVYDLYDNISYLELNPVIVEMSPPLSEIISYINKKSLNLASEMLLKAIGKESSGEGSFSRGIEKVKSFLSAKGINTEELNIVDGSGLSRLNFISPSAQVNLLSDIYSSKYKKDFIASLANPGKEGTLSKRMTGTRAEYNVFAKTGTMNGVSNISGYVFTRDGEPLAFSIMMMNFAVPENLAQNLQDLILMRLASLSTKN